MDNVNLSGANLRKANLRKAKLRGALLREADLTGADLSGADLSCREYFNTYGARLMFNRMMFVDHPWEKAEQLYNEFSENSIKIHESLYEEATGEEYAGSNFWLPRRTILNRADLFMANLSDVNFYGADISEANLKEANFLNANLSLTSIHKSVLIKANLNGATMLRADFSGANLSGVSLDDCNFSRWIIKDITCTHIFRYGKRFDYAEGEFEKSFSQFENIIELILNAPCSDFTHYTGKIVANLLNEKYGEAVVFFKGQEAISNGSTQHKYLSFADKNRTAEIQRKMSEIQQKVDSIYNSVDAKQGSKDIFGLPEEAVLIPGVLVARPKEIYSKLNERFLTLSPVLQKVIESIQHIIQ